MLPETDVISVRLDPALELGVEVDGPLGRAHRIGDELVFRWGRVVTVRIGGDPRRLDLLERLVEGRPKLLPDDLGAVLLPRDLAAFADHLRLAEDTVRALLDEGRLLVEAAERLVCRLYGLPTDLEDEVVAHAVARATARVSAAAEDE